MASANITVHWQHANGSRIGNSNSGFREGHFQNGIIIIIVFVVFIIIIIIIVVIIIIVIITIVNFFLSIFIIIYGM